MTEPERLMNLARDCAMLRKHGRLGPEIQRELRRMETRFKARSWALEVQQLKQNQIDR